MNNHSSKLRLQNKGRGGDVLVSKLDICSGSEWTHFLCPSEQERSELERGGRIENMMVKPLHLVFGMTRLCQVLYG